MGCANQPDGNASSSGGAESDHAGIEAVIGRSNLMGMLQGLNPWWVGKSARPMPFRRTPYFVCRRHLEGSANRRAILLSGARQVGKTTILKQMATDLVAEGVEPKSVCYLSLDSPALRKLPLRKVLRIYHEGIYSEGKPAVLLLDEVQYCEDWDLELKHLIDHHQHYRIVATGSASLEHRQKLAESGVGRWRTVHVPPLSFYEFLHLRETDLSGLPEQMQIEDVFSLERSEQELLPSRFRSLLPLFGRYLLIGGFPEHARTDNVAVAQSILEEDVVGRVLRQDMPGLFNIRNVQNLERLFVYLCQHSGGIFSQTNCARALGSTKATVSNHLEALQEANLVHLVRPFQRTGKKSLKSPPKVYLVDAALRNSILRKGEEVLSDPDEMGLIVETCVLRHLISHYAGQSARITYWQGKRRRKEVDFVVRTPRANIPVEVKYRSQAGIDRNSGMAAFCEEHKPESGFWITRREEDLDVEPTGEAATKLLRIPAHIFTYLLGQTERMRWAQPEERT